jgi:AraC-like DNA-binding protein
MKFQTTTPYSDLSPFVKSIMVFEGVDDSSKTILPFFADGFPGMMYHKTPNGLTINPHKKVMPELFIYGQTIEPIEIEIFGKYEIIVFQLYPSTLSNFFGIQAKSINDNCYDLTQLQETNIKRAVKLLPANSNSAERIDTICSLLRALLHEKKHQFDPMTKIAIEKILESKGQLNLNHTATELNISKRTFERHFLFQTGLLPKQFAKIIQFQSSLSQLTIKDYKILTDVVYENGYADQSHFIKVFKSFTGKTPKKFSKIYSKQ